MKKKLTSIAVALLIMGTIIIAPISASAKTYSTWSTRGIKYFCWSEDSITWSANNYKIISTSTNQKRSGLFVVNNGIKKEKARSNSKKYSMLCKHTFLVGAVVSGVTLGWNHDINDRWTIYNNGRAYINWDV